MALAQLDAVRKVFDRVRDDADPGDGELLTRYRQMRDQAAFGSLVRRHGPMVLGVCRRVLRDDHAADDAFQATFLVLAKRAGAVRPPDRLAPWLYGVAYRTSLKARGRAYRRQQVEQAYAAEVRNQPPVASDECADLLPIIDEQLNALPEKYRDPLVLCGVQGLNKAEAAEKLGLPEGTVSSRLARAREMLRDRLSRRGVVVPVAALATLLTADALQAAVTPTLATAATGSATGTALVSPTVLTLSQEVLHSMTLLKLKTLCVVAMSVALTGGGFGLYAISADEKKPAQGEKPVVKPEKPDGEKPATKPDGEKPKPANPDGEKPKPAKPDGEKPRVSKSGGQVASVDAKENTITLAIKGDGGVVEKLFPVAPDAKVFIDGKEAKLADVPKNSTASFVAAAPKEGKLPVIGELRVTGSTVTGAITLLGGNSVTFGGEGNARTYKLAPDGKVTINGKDAKFADLKLGEKVVITMKADESAALVIAAGTKIGDGEKPKPEKPAKESKFGGKIGAVDAKANTITLVHEGDGAVPDRVVKLTPGAKVLVDGKEAKLADVPKGAYADLVFAPGKDGEKEKLADEVRVVGHTYIGLVKRVESSSITLGTEKVDGAVCKLSADSKVTVNGAVAKLTDIKPGDKASVTMTTTGQTVLTVASWSKPDGEKPEKPGIKNPKFGGKIASVDATTRTVTLAAKGEGGKEIVVKLTADAKITVDGKEVKIGDIPKGAFATLTLVSAKDGQPREANELIVAGQTFFGVIKQVDTTSVTIGNEKSDRVVKLAAGGKVMIGEKEGKLADLKVGDKVSVTLTSDESAATVIQSGVKKPAGDKPKPEKPEEDEDQ